METIDEPGTKPTKKRKSKPKDSTMFQRVKGTTIYVSSLTTKKKIEPLKKQRKREYDLENPRL